MSCKQLTKRIIANVATLDGNKLRMCKLLSDSDWGKIGTGAADIGNWSAIINDELATSSRNKGILQRTKI